MMSRKCAGLKPTPASGGSWLAIGTPQRPVRT
jgi:hypothetical protein